MSFDVFAFVMQDGLTLGAIYALLSIVLVFVFSVTRVIFIPLGEFVAFGALTLAALRSDRVPGTVWLVLILGMLVGLRAVATDREVICKSSALARSACVPVIAAIVYVAAPLALPLAIDVALTLLLVGVLGPLIYRLAYKPIEHLSVLILLIASVAVHLLLTGAGLAMFGPEGFRTPTFLNFSFTLGPLFVAGQSLLIYVAAILFIFGFFAFFRWTMEGSALRATAANRTGARLIGIRTSSAGETAFGVAAVTGAASGMLIAPLATIFYDTGFLIGLKGFIAAIFGGLVSFPVAAVGAVALGLLESYVSYFDSSLRDVIIFALVVPILLFRSLTHKGSDRETSN